MPYLLAPSIASRRAPQNVPRINRQHSIGASLVGLLHCGVRPRDLVNGRIPTFDSTPSIRPEGLAQVCSTTLGIYTARREWPSWEITWPLSFFAYFYLTAYASAAATFMGNTGGATGYAFSERFGTGHRRYSVNGDPVQSVDPSGTWPLDTPSLAALTLDTAGNLNAYLNGEFEGLTTGCSAPTYSTFSQVFAGDTPDLGELTGGVWYMGICNRALSYAEIRSLAADPFLIYEPEPRSWFFTGGAVPQSPELFGAISL